MASMETAVIISVFLALVLLFVDFLILPSVAVSVLFIVLFTGFIASAMAGSERNSYKVGGFAGAVLAVMLFLVSFFTGPTLSFNIYSLGLDLSLISQGFIYLILSFVLSLAIYMFLGAFGGIIAQELLGPKDSEPENTESV